MDFPEWRMSKMPNKIELAENILINMNYHYTLKADEFITERENLVKNFTKRELWDRLWLADGGGFRTKDASTAYWERLKYVNRMDEIDFYKLVRRVAEGKQEEDEDDEPYYNMFSDEIIWRHNKYGPMALWATFPRRFEEYMDCILNQEEKVKEILQRFFSR